MHLLTVTLKWNWDYFSWKRHLYLNFICVTGKTRFRGLPLLGSCLLAREELRWETTRTVEVRWQVCLSNTLEHEAASGHPASLSAVTIGTWGGLCLQPTSRFSVFLPFPDLGINTQFQRLSFPDNGNDTYRTQGLPSSCAIMAFLVTFGTPGNFIGPGLGLPS